MILTVPHDDVLYPTLGPQVCDFIEQNLVFGPGDLRGQPAVLDDETRALIFRMYEVFPVGHPQAGRRRFKRVGLSLRKGSAKTEKAAWIAACELHPEAPVRCTGFSKAGEPIGGPVSDPYIPLVAYTEEQSEDLAFGALRVILELSTLKDDFIIGLERIERKKGDGKAVPLATAPDARDGARTTFNHFDETHRFTLPRLVRAHQVMLANIPKRRAADAWSLETTTAPEPGTGSVAEATMEYARKVQAGIVQDSRLFYFHRQAGDEHDLTTEDGLRAAIAEASGSIGEWSDLDGILEQWRDPNADRAYLERVWLNRLVRSTTQAFDPQQWAKLARPRTVARRRQIAIGFDGAMFHDGTGLVCTDVIDGYQWAPGVWEKPATASDDWQVPTEEVDALVRNLFEEFDVWRMYADPWLWQAWTSKWAGEFGKDRVIEWFTNRPLQMAAALDNFNSAIKEGRLSHDGSKDLARHVANARRRAIHQRDAEGRQLWIIQKDRPDSPFKIDLAMAAVLSWEARTDAIAAGAAQPKKKTRPAMLWTPNGFTPATATEKTHAPA
jgi:phage terminase large subunit-like protein